MRNPVVITGSWQLVGPSPAELAASLTGGVYWIGLSPFLAEPGRVSVVGVSAFGAVGRFRLLGLTVNGETHSSAVTDWLPVGSGWSTTEQLAIEVPARASVVAMVELEKGTVVPQILVGAYLRTARDPRFELTANKSAQAKVAELKGEAEASKAYAKAVEDVISLMESVGLIEEAAIVKGFDLPGYERGLLEER